MRLRCGAGRRGTGRGRSSFGVAIAVAAARGQEDAEYDDDTELQQLCRKKTMAAVNILHEDQLSFLMEWLPAYGGAGNLSLYSEN